MATATTRIANAHWEGSLLEGAGNVSLDSSNTGTFDVTWASRAEKPDGLTSPEELIGAALSTCFSMALSHGLAGNGHAPQEVDTRAEVDFVPGTGISQIRLTVRARVEGLSNDEFVAAAEDARVNCPVSQALKAVDITLDAALKD
jgi:osmotically inducible protein OsmC